MSLGRDQTPYYRSSSLRYSGKILLHSPPSSRKLGSFVKGGGNEDSLGKMRYGNTENSAAIDMFMYH